MPVLMESNMNNKQEGFIQGFVQACVDKGLTPDETAFVLNKTAELDPTLAPTINEWLASPQEKSAGIGEHIAKFIHDNPELAYALLGGAGGAGIGTGVGAALGHTGRGAAIGAGAGGLAGLAYGHHKAPEGKGTTTGERSGKLSSEPNKAPGPKGENAKACNQQDHKATDKGDVKEVETKAIRPPGGRKPGPKQ